MKPTLFISLIGIMLSCNFEKQEVNQHLEKKIDEAEQFIDEGAFEKAIQILEAEGSDTKEGAYLLGYAYLKTKQFDKSFASFKYVYKIDPKYRHTCFNLAQCLLEQINLDDPWNKRKSAIANKVIAFLSEGIKLKEEAEIDDSIYAQYFANRGQLYQLNGSFDKALNDFDRAIELDPHGDYFSRRAMTYYFAGKNELACSDFQKAHQLGVYLNTLAILKICPYFEMYR